MAALPDPPVLTTDGNYDLANLDPGREYRLELTGTFDGATVALQQWDGSAFVAGSQGPWTAAGSADVVARASSARFVVSNDGASTSITVSLVPIAPAKTFGGGGSVTASSIAAAIEDDPALVREALGVVETWVVEGDSLTAADQGGGYLTWAEHLEAITRNAISNVATVGQRTDQMVSSFAASVAPLLTATSGKPSIFFLLAGTNDSPTLSATQTRDNLRSMWASAKAAGAKVCAFTMPHRASGGWSEADQRVINTQIVADYEAGLVDFIVRTDIIFSNSASSDFSDGLHMTTLGQKKLAAQVLNVLNGGECSPGLPLASAYLTMVTGSVNATTAKLRFSQGFGVDRNFNIRLGTVGGTPNVTYFQAPVTGVYDLKCRLMCSGMTAGNSLQLSWWVLPVGGSAVEFRGQVVTAAGSTDSVAADFVHALGAGDIAYVELSTSGTTNLVANAQFALFSGALLHLYR